MSPLMYEKPLTGFVPLVELRVRLPVSAPGPVGRKKMLGAGLAANSSSYSSVTGSGL